MRLFGDILGELAGGTVYERLSEQLAAVAKAVSETGKAGDLTLKIKIKANGDAGAAVTTEIKSKIPESDLGQTFYFVSHDGSLQRNDPKQQNLPLREVPAAMARAQ